jgi:hypothetical protein
VTVIFTNCSTFRKARPAANSTDATFPSRIPTATEPTGDGVIELGGSGNSKGAYTQNGIVVVSYGTGSNNDTFSTRLIGWRQLGEATAATALWIPVVLVEMACTLSAVVGVAGKIIVAGERFVDTMVLTTGDAGVSVDTVSPTGDVVAHFVADVKGFQKAELTFQITSGTTDMNALVALL